MNENKHPLGLSQRVLDMARQAEADIRGQFAHIDAVAEYNSQKVLAAFQNHRVAEAHFPGTTGYGAEIFGTEDALVRIQFVNGTHAIASALYGALKPGDTLLSAVGAPYDTLLSVIGVTGDEPGSLKEYGIGYRQVDVTADDLPDKAGLAQAVQAPDVKVVLIQRSKGYSTRASLSVAEIGELIAIVKEHRPDVTVIVDNLIKNPGGGLAPTGGYLAGRHDLVEAAAKRLTVPGIGRECGSTLGNNRLLYQGLFLAPHTVAQAVKTAVFNARMMELLGYQTEPRSDQERHDIIQMVSLEQPELVEKYCKGIQSGSPVDSYVTPVPWDMPGYDCQVIMAAGAFIQGASIELSADAPMRPPYTVYMQGGLTYESGKTGVLLAVEELLKG